MPEPVRFFPLERHTSVMFHEKVRIRCAKVGMGQGATKELMGTLKLWGHDGGNARVCEVLRRRKSPKYLMGWRRVPTMGR